MNNEPNISLYGEGTGEDFPVLKAFQQYIDAEQAKARRRLVTVSILFACVLVAVIGIFSFLVISANERSQSLNDRLIEFAMKEADRKVDAARAAAVQEASVKAMTETLQQLQKQVEQQSRKAEAAAANVAKELAPRPQVDPAALQRQQENDEKLQRAVALLKAEKAKLAAEKEKLRQAELERYRREHYPEYYAKQEAKAAAKARLELDLDDLDDLEPDDEEEVEVKRPASKAKKEVEEVDLDADDAIEYFNEEEDNLVIPVKVKGKRANWRVPLD